VQVLEEENVHNLVTIGEYPLYMVPLDEDVLSFELDLANKVWLLFLFSPKDLLDILFVYPHLYYLPFLFFFPLSVAGMPS